MQDERAERVGALVVSLNVLATGSLVARVAAFDHLDAETELAKFVGDAEAVGARVLAEVETWLARAT